MSSTTNGNLSEPRFGLEEGRNWRVVASHLDASQVRVLAKWEERGRSDRDLLDKAMAYGSSNLARALYFENLPLPKDAGEVFEPPRCVDGMWVRHFRGDEREVTKKD